MRVAALAAPASGAERSFRCGIVMAAVALVLGLSVSTPVPAFGATPDPAPLESGSATPAGSWLVLPMGQRSDESNTFWQLLHAPAGSAHWSVVTPPGAADNAGIVAGTSGNSVLVGVLPNGLLRFSPVSLSSDGGGRWGPVFLPGALAAEPDALAYDAAASPSTVAVAGRMRVLSSGVGMSSWKTLVTAARLSRVAPRCGVTKLNAVALQPGGGPLVAAACAHGGVVGLFADVAGAWKPSGLVLGGSLGGSSTSVIRLETEGSTVAALVSASHGSRGSLIAIWHTAGEPWKESTPLSVGAGQPVLATAVGPNGTLAVLLATSRGEALDDIAPAGSWSQLPPPPRGAVALAPAATPAALGAPAFDVFTVSGADLGVFALTPSAASWTKVQSTRVPLAYGSSS